MSWGSPVEKEKKRRIQIALWAYAYEIADSPLVDDATYDRVSLEIDPSIETGHKKLDKFFKEGFSPSTGQWIYNHPELHKVVALYRRVTE